MKSAQSQSPFAFVDLFAGLGGFHVGLQRLGGRCRLACELDPALRALYRTNFGIGPWPDIRTLDEDSVPRHDLLAAGFPCQPFSKAGEQLGLNCDRDGDLFGHILRILKRRSPRLLMLENVANLVAHDEGETWRWMERELGDLGYQVRKQVLSPHAFGIPQIRDRVFIVGAIGGLRDFDWPTAVDEEPKITSVLDTHPKEARRLPQHYVRCLNVWQEFLDRIPASSPLPSFPIWSFEFDATYPLDGVPPALREPSALARYRGSFGDSLKGLTHDQRMAALPSYARGVEPFPSWKQAFIRQNREFFQLHRSRLVDWIPKIREFASSLQKLEWNCKGAPRNLREHILQFRASGVRVKRSNWAPALIAMTTTQVPVIYREERYMTVRECARLQGLGDLSEFPSVATRAYRALGNAVSADLVSLIASNLLRACPPKSSSARLRAVAR